MKVLHLVVTTLFLTTTAKGGTLWQGYTSLSSVPNATADLDAFLIPVTWTIEDKHSSVVNALSPYDPEETENAVVSYLCTMNGAFPRPGSCRSFYRCEEAEHRPGVYTVQLVSCPAGTMFSKSTTSCLFPIPESNWKECLMQRQGSPSYNTTAKDLQGSRWTVNYFEPFNSLKRAKRLNPGLILTGILALSSVVSTANQLFNGGRSQSANRAVGEHLREIEHKLYGVDAKLKSIGLSVLENNIESRIYSEMTNDLITRAIQGNQLSSDMTRKLIERGFLEQRISTAELQGMVIHENAKSVANFAKIHVSIGDLKEFIKEEITKTKVVLQRGFESVPDIIDLSKLETLVSNLLIIIKGFHEHLDHLESLPERNRKDEIERPGGYLEYLKSSELPNTINQIIQQRYAIPSAASDSSAVLTLDLLVHGLQVYTKILSSVVSSNAYLASKALEELQLESFNTFMQRVHSGVERVKIVLGYGDKSGLIAEIKEVLSEAQALPFVSEIRHFSELLSEKSTDIKKLEKDIEDLIVSNKQLHTPGTITGKPAFSDSSPSVPIGRWARGKTVMYAIQLVSDSGLSSVGEWSTPYIVSDKACPIIKLPKAETGVVRFLYRKFDQENPELVAIVKNNVQTSVIDIYRDILNAAVTPNEDVAIREIRALINYPGLDIDLSLENRMTPLHYAAKQGNVKVMDELINKKANVRARAYENQQPLHFAALFGEKNGIEYLIEKGADINAQTSTLGLSPLHIAVANGHVDATESLIEKGAFINIRDNNGLTPLHMAVAGNGDVIDILLQNDNLDVNAVADNEFTPLHYASMSYSKDIAEKLLQSDKILVNAKTDALLAPIHLAAMSGNVETITNLKQKGASLSVVDIYGSTALHYATFYGQSKAILAIMQLEPSLQEVKDKVGDTVQVLAEQNKRQDIVEIFTSDKNNLINIFKEEFSGEGTAAANQTSSGAEDCEANDIADQMLIGTEDTCNSIGDIDSYVNLVSSLIPLQVYYQHHKYYSEMFVHFDRDLRIAQQNANQWRNGDSIVKAISKTFELAKNFEPEFQRKYKINKKIMKEISEEAKLQQEPIRIIRNEIKYLEDKITSTSSMMHSTDNPILKEYFQNEIKDYLTRIENKTTEMNKNFTLIEKFQQTLSFLTFVKKDSEKIKLQAQDTKVKVENFKDLLVKDKAAFERHKNNTKLSLADIKSRNETKNAEMAKLISAKQKLEHQIEVARNETKAIFRKMHEDQDELRQIRKKLMEQIQSNSVKKIVGAVFSPLFIGIPILIAASVEENSLISSLENSVSESMLRIQTFSLENQERNNEITRLAIEIAKTSSTSETVRQELLAFILVEQDLKTLSYHIEIILDSIGRAIQGISIVKDIFDNVTTRLEDMIELARKAKTEADIERVLDLNLHDISSLLCKWNQVYDMVSSLHECVSSYRFLVFGRSQMLSSS